MRRLVGHIKFSGRHLKYYVFGNRNEGFGVEITETCVEKENRIVTKSFEEAQNLAKKLQRSSVFPANLNEILDDYEFENQFG